MQFIAIYQESALSEPQLESNLRKLLKYSTVKTLNLLEYFFKVKTALNQLDREHVTFVIKYLYSFRKSLLVLLSDVKFLFSTFMHLQR